MVLGTVILSIITTSEHWFETAANMFLKTLKIDDAGK